MTWLIVILVVAAIGGLTGYLNSGKKDDAVSGALGAGLGCGYIIFQIFLAILGLTLLLAIGNWLFG